MNSGSKSPQIGAIKVSEDDSIHGISSNQEFMIKSFLNSKPIKFNENTNIVYKITDINNAPITDQHFNEINSITSRHKYIDRVTKLMKLGYNIEFYAYDDTTFKLNLQVIDSDLPEIIAHIVKDKYVSRISKLNEVIKKITEENPMNYDQSQGHKFYEYRLVSFFG